jgi:hypothetical protein
MPSVFGAKVKQLLRDLVSFQKKENIIFVEPKSPWEIQLGMYVIDHRANLHGWVVASRETLSGMIQYAIQRATPDGRPTLDPEFSDWNNLEYEKDGMRLKVTPPLDAYRFNLGNWAREPLSGSEGVVIEKMTHLNGCVTIHLSYKAEDGKGGCVGLDVHANRLEKLDRPSFIPPGLLEAQKTEKPFKTGTGGFGKPMNRL